MIGILMLDTHFPRLLGDIGNPDTFANPPLYARVDRATVETVVKPQPPNQKTQYRFIDAAKALEQQGATIIGTSCGFLASAQLSIQRVLKVPFISSSLTLIPLLKKLFGQDATIGVLTFDPAHLGPVHFDHALDETISIHGLKPSDTWYQCIKNDHTEIDPATAEAEVLNIAERCLQAKPDTKFFILECTNLSPWKKQLKEKFGLPVFDLVDALEWLDSA